MPVTNEGKLSVECDGFSQQFCIKTFQKLLTALQFLLEINFPNLSSYGRSLETSSSCRGKLTNRFDFGEYVFVPTAPSLFQSGRTCSF